MTHDILININLSIHFLWFSSELFALFTVKDVRITFKICEVTAPNLFMLM